MKLIEEFENGDIQNVAAFNAIFKSTPILDVPDDVEVQIMEPANADRRWIKVGEEFIRLHLTQTGDDRSVKKSCKEALTIRQKPCTSCLLMKPIEDFTAHAKSRGGRRSACKACYNVKCKNWKLINKQKESNELHNLTK